MTIHLLGSMATSENLADKLERALIHLRPKIITVETSQEWIDYENQHNEDIKKDIMYVFIEGYVDLGIIKYVESYINQQLASFDVAVSRKFTQNHNIPIHFVGDPRDIESFYNSMKYRIKKLFFSLTRQTSKTIVQSISTEEQCENARYRIFEDLINDDIYLEELVPDLAEIFIGSIEDKRNKYTANNLLQLTRENPNSRIVNVGNPLNLVDDVMNRTLYSKIKHLNPERSTLIRY